MSGLFLAVLVFGFSSTSKQYGCAFNRAAKFLCIWYCAICAILCFSAIAFFVSGGALAGFIFGYLIDAQSSALMTKIGAVLGAGRAAIDVLILLFIFAFSIAGAFILAKESKQPKDLKDFSKRKIITGFALIIIGTYLWHL